MEDELLTTLDEFDITRKFQFPHTFRYQNISQKKDMAGYFLSKNVDELLLITSSGFSTGFILAGISEKNIEYIAINAPNEYKEEIIKSLTQEHVRQEVFEIAREMDDDLGKGMTQNQDRVRNVIQYVLDNRVVFQF